MFIINYIVSFNYMVMINTIIIKIIIVIIDKINHLFAEMNPKMMFVKCLNVVFH